MTNSLHKTDYCGFGRDFSVEIVRNLWNIQFHMFDSFSREDHAVTICSRYEPSERFFSALLFDWGTLLLLQDTICHVIDDTEKPGTEQTINSFGLVHKCKEIVIRSSVYSGDNGNHWSNAIFKNERSRIPMMSLSSNELKLFAKDLGDVASEVEDEVQARQDNAQFELHCDEWDRR